MKPLVFLAIALGVSVVGSLLVVLRNRKPHSPYGELDDFAHRMDALAPPDDPTQQRPSPERPTQERGR